MPRTSEYGNGGFAALFTAGTCLLSASEESPGSDALDLERAIKRLEMVKAIAEAVDWHAATTRLVVVHCSHSDGYRRSPWTRSSPSDLRVG